MGYIHVRFSVYLSKRERIHILESMQHDALLQMTEINKAQERIQGKIDNLLGPFPGLQFNGKEGRLLYQKGGEQSH